VSHHFTHALQYLGALSPFACACTCPTPDAAAAAATEAHRVPYDTRSQAPFNAGFPTYTPPSLPAGSPTQVIFEFPDDPLPPPGLVEEREIVLSDATTTPASPPPSPSPAAAAALPSSGAGRSTGAGAGAGSGTTASEGAALETIVAMCAPANQLPLDALRPDLACLVVPSSQPPLRRAIAPLFAVGPAAGSVLPALAGRVCSVDHTGRRVFLHFTDADRAASWGCWVDAAQLRRLPTAGDIASADAHDRARVHGALAALESARAQQLAEHTLVAVLANWPSGVPFAMRFFGAPRDFVALLTLLKMHEGQHPTRAPPQLAAMERRLAEWVALATRAPAGPPQRPLSPVVATPLSRAVSVCGPPLAAPDEPSLDKVLLECALDGLAQAQVSLMAAEQFDYGRAQIYETHHPYAANMNERLAITIPGATSLRVRFNRHCRTVAGTDRLLIYADPDYKRLLYEFSGRADDSISKGESVGGKTVLCNRILVVPNTNAIYLHFVSTGGSKRDWGIKLIVLPGDEAPPVRHARAAYSLALSSLRTLFAQNLPPTHPLYGAATASALIGALVQALAHRGAPAQAGAVAHLVTRYLERWPELPTTVRSAVPLDRLTRLVAPFRQQMSGRQLPALQEADFYTLELLVALESAARAPPLPPLLPLPAQPAPPPSSSGTASIPPPATSPLPAVPLLQMEDLVPLEGLTPFEQFLALAAFNECYLRRAPSPTLPAGTAEGGAAGDADTANTGMPAVADAATAATPPAPRIPPRFFASTITAMTSDRLVESPHPLPRETWVADALRFSEATALRVTLDPRMNLAAGHTLTLTSDGSVPRAPRGSAPGVSIHTFQSGSDPTVTLSWQALGAALHAPNAGMGRGDWGASFAVHPIYPPRVSQARLLPQRDELQRLYVLLHDPALAPRGLDAELGRLVNSYVAEHGTAPAFVRPGVLLPPPDSVTPLFAAQYPLLAAVIPRVAALMRAPDAPLYDPIHVRFWLWRVYNALLPACLPCFNLAAANVVDTLPHRLCAMRHVIDGRVKVDAWMRAVRADETRTERMTVTLNRTRRGGPFHLERTTFYQLMSSLRPETLRQQQSDVCTAAGRPEGGSAARHPSFPLAPVSPVSVSSGSTVSGGPKRSGKVDGERPAHCFRPHADYRATIGPGKAVEGGARQGFAQGKQ